MKKLKYQKVDSSNISSVMYLPEQQELFILFKSKGHYKYSPVSQELFDNFMKAESKGSFFFQNIKSNPSIKYEKIEEPKRAQGIKG